jgi:hypothetical protein
MPSRGLEAWLAVISLDEAHEPAGRRDFFEFTEEQKMRNAAGIHIKNKKLDE